jgi:hypothetical protein
VLYRDGSQHRFASAPNGNSASEFAYALVSEGIRLGTTATVERRKCVQKFSNIMFRPPRVMTFSRNTIYPHTPRS